MWRGILERAPRDILQAADRELMIAYVGNIRVLEQAIVEERACPLVDDEGRPSPYRRLLRQHSEVLNTLAAQFGFTPVARTRLGTPVGTGEAEEPTTNLHLRRLQLVEPDGKGVARPAAK